MAVTRYWNPTGGIDNLGAWELIGVGVQGPRGDKGNPGPEGDPGVAGTQIYYTETPPSGANLGDMWVDKNGFTPVETVKQGTFVERPAATVAITGMLFWATDHTLMYYCDGAIWHSI